MTVACVSVTKAWTAELQADRSQESLHTVAMLALPPSGVGGQVSGRPPIRT